jgi:hypothetical protein
MIPVGDDNSDRERWPAVTAVFIAINIAAFLYEASLPDRQLLQFVYSYAVVPATRSSRVSIRSATTCRRRSICRSSRRW